MSDILGFGRAKQLAKVNYGILKEYRGLFCWDEFDTIKKKMVTNEGILFEDLAIDIRQSCINRFVGYYATRSMDEVINSGLRIPEWVAK